MASAFQVVAPLSSMPGGIPFDSRPLDLGPTDFQERFSELKITLHRLLPHRINMESLSMMGGGRASE